MATLFKRNILKPIPADAEMIEQGGKHFARVRDGGRPVKYEVVGDQMLIGQSRKWYGKIEIAPRKLKTVTLYTDKGVSEAKLKELQRDAEKRDAGFVTADTDRWRLPIAELAEAYHNSLRLARRNDAHVRISEMMVDKLIDLGKWQRAADITCDSMEKILGTLAAAGKTASYQNKFIARAKALVNWALPADKAKPLAKLRRISEKGAKRTRERRAATPEQLKALFSLKDLPEQRRLAYALAAFNGLRRNEIESLKWEALKLSATIPFLGVKQKQGKDDKLDYIPLHPYVASLLADTMQAMPDVDVVRFVPDVKTLKKDWKRAGVAMVDEKGRRLDFHALRHTFQTELDRTGCSRATKKKLMRHAGDDVTDGYAHAELAEMLVAISRIQSPDTDGQAALKTGTDDGPAGGSGNEPARTTERTTATSSTADESLQLSNMKTAKGANGSDGIARQNRGEVDECLPQSTTDLNQSAKAAIVPQNRAEYPSGLQNQSVKSGAFRTGAPQSAPSPDLQKIIDAWPTLPQSTRDAIALLVDAART